MKKQMNLSNETMKLRTRSIHHIVSQ
jgi:hypothetical protein